MKYLLASTPSAVVEARGCTQVPAFVPFTAISKGKPGKLYAIVEVLGVEAAEPEPEPEPEVDVTWLV